MVKLALITLVAAGGLLGCDGVLGITEVKGGSGSGCSSICYVQSTNELAPGGSPTPLAFHQAPAPGNLIVLAVVTYENNVTAVTDSAGNTYHATDLVTTAGQALLTVFYAANIQVTDAFSVTVITEPLGSSPEATLALHEYTGASAAPLDQQAHAVDFGMMPDTGVVTTAVSGELYFAMMVHDGDAVSSRAAPYTLRERPTDDTVTHVPLLTEDMTGPAEMTSATFELSSSTGWAAMLLTFLPASP